MVGYHCDCGMYAFTDGYDLKDVKCVRCGEVGAEGKTELTKDSDDLYLAEYVWAWRYTKKEPFDKDWHCKNSFFGFKAGTPLMEIADWFITSLSDFASDDGVEEEEDSEEVDAVDFDEDDEE